MLERPTRIRYIVVAGAFLMSILLYLDRFCISVAVVFMEEDLGLVSWQSDVIFSAFFWTYALGQVPSGWLTDRFGSRVMLTTYILAWSLLTGLVGMANSFLAIVLLRAAFGLAQAGAYPAAASIVRKWIPVSGRGGASGIVAVGGRIGASLAMFVTPYLLIAFTPQSTPATIGPADFLPGHGPRLCFNLVTRPSPPTPASSLQQRWFEALPNEVQMLVQTHAARYAKEKQAAEERSKQAGEDPKKAVVKLPLPPEDARRIADGLNGVLTRRDLVWAEHVSEVKIESEAKRLLRQPREELSDEQVQRLNRLVLEALQTGNLRRIYGTGWRPIMFLYGFLGVGVAALVWWSSRTSPREHPRCNAAEVALIEGPQLNSTSPAARQLGPLPLRPLVSNLGMWLCCVTQFFTNLGWFFLLIYMPKYLLNVHRVSLAELALMGLLVPIAGWVGMLAGGPATDFLIGRWGLRWGRAWPIALSRFLAMGAYIVCLFSPSPWLAVAMFSIVAFGTDFGSPAVWAYCQDVGGRHVASILGWGNMWGNFGAAIGPLTLPWVLGTSEDWNMAFVAFAAAFFLSGIAALGINAARPIVASHE